MLKLPRFRQASFNQHIKILPRAWLNNSAITEHGIREPAKNARHLRSSDGNFKIHHNKLSEAIFVLTALNHWTAYYTLNSGKDNHSQSPQEGPQQKLEKLELIRRCEVNNWPQAISAINSINEVVRQFMMGWKMCLEIKEISSWCVHLAVGTGPCWDSAVPMKFWSYPSCQQDSVTDPRWVHARPFVKSKKL